MLHMHTKSTSVVHYMYITERVGTMLHHITMFNYRYYSRALLVHLNEIA